MIKANTLPKINRTFHAIEILNASLSIDSTDIELYNKEGNVTMKIITDLPDFLTDSSANVYHLVRKGKIRCYIHRKGEKRIAGYEGRYGIGYMLLFPEWNAHCYSKVGYYVLEGVTGCKRRRKGVNIDRR